MRQLALLVLKTLVSIVVAVSAPYFGFSISPQDKLVIALLIFACWTLLEILVTLRSMRATNDRALVLWQIEDNFDKTLANIRSSFQHLVRHGYGVKDLFADYFSSTLHDIEKSIKNASETRRLPLRNYHFRSIENVLAAFEGSPVKSFMELWVLENNEAVFDNELSREYFTQIAIMARKGHLKNVRTIFLYADQSDLEREDFKRLLTFYASWRGFDCRLVKKATCDSLMRDENIYGTCIDFGIYGDRYLFRTERYKPEVVGVFVRDPQEIRQYTRFFENLWASAGAIKNPQRSSSNASLEEIVGEDIVRTVGG